MTDPLATIALTIRTRPNQRGRRKLRVYIWKTKKELRAAAKEMDASVNWSDASGCYIATRVSSFGQIHLWKKLIGAGYWAHELQHFMNDYSEETENYPLDHDANERMAWLAGELTKEFWIKYGKFEVKQ